MIVVIAFLLAETCVGTCDASGSLSAAFSVELNGTAMTTMKPAWKNRAALTLRFISQKANKRKTLHWLILKIIK